jgi:hypothetical protein
MWSRSDVDNYQRIAIPIGLLSQPAISDSASVESASAILLVSLPLQQLFPF